MGQVDALRAGHLPATLQEAGSAADTRRMDEPNGVPAADGEPAKRVRELRRERGLSRRALARRAGLASGAVVAIERGRHVPSEGELAQIAGACGVEPEALVPVPRPDLALAAGSGTSPLRGEAALDALLREYLSMVAELRSNRQASPESLRQGDLSELARALGDSPDAIEARLMQLLGSDEHEACELRAAIVPSSDVPSRVEQSSI